MEAEGLRARAGEISWREAAELAGLRYHQPLKTHMDKHYVDVVQVEVRNAIASAEAEFDGLVNESILGLQEQMRLAPPEVKPLYAVAIQNLGQLKQTKGSQQNLISALKTIQEMTGMRQGQRLMLQFAEAMFAEVEAKKERVALPPADVIEVEPLD